ncbi:MAG TPA: FGGY family carbohydrate kinase [Anaerolineaceae bacterium]|nr:FGGY family carbohydrate kinase [Anaerolineaceae bacterium]
MPKEYLIGVDLGTSGTKAALYHADGRLVAEASLEVPLYYPRPGVVEQENEDFYRTAARAVQRCMQDSGIDPRQVAGIAFDSQMAGVGSIDADYRPVTRFDSWLDMRCQPYIEWMEREAGERVTQITGCPPTCDHGPKMLWWKNECPDDYRRVVKFLMPAAYVAGRMAGLRGDQAFIDYTFIHFSGFADAQKGVWSAELCQLFGLDMEKLPRIVSPWEVIGEVNEAAARDFGLAPGTIIAAGAGDTAANALGAGIVRPGMVFDVAGTAAVLAGCTDAFVTDVKHRALLTMRSVIPGLWNPLAYIAGGGLALRWFRDQFYNTRRGQPLPSESDLYAEMTAWAQQTPVGSDGLMFSPHLGGRICPASPAMRGAWVGFSWGHTQAHFFRAVLESVAYEYAFYLRILRDLLPDLELVEARAVGGGARSPVWNQIKADVLGVPYQRLDGSEFGTWGAALIAGRAAGVFADLASRAAKSTRLSGSPVQPDPANQAVYRPLIEQYIRLEESLNEYFTHESRALP